MALRKTVSTGGAGWGGGFEWLRMKHICPCFTPSRKALEKQSRLTMLSTRCFSLEQETLRHSRYMILLIFMKKGRQHHITINYQSCFHSRWPNAKTKLKWNHLWEQGGPWCFGPPTQLAYSAYREDRLCEYMDTYIIRSNGYSFCVLNNICFILKEKQPLTCILWITKHHGLS